MMLARARHRLRQFLGALRPHVSAEQRAGAYRYLNDAQRSVFESMTLRDQQHGIEVLSGVTNSTSTEDPALFVAALLHDCGKGHVRLWQRVGFVLLAVAAPWLLTKIAVEHGSAWRQAFWRLLHHPELGARIVAATGADADTVRMIRDQDASGPDARLALLQAADDA